MSEINTNDPQIRQVLIMVGDPKAIGHQWLLDFLDQINERCKGKQIGVTFDELIMTASTFRHFQPMQHDYLVRPFGNLMADEEFWKHFMNYTGYFIIPENRRDFLINGD